MNRIIIVELNGVLHMRQRLASLVCPRSYRRWRQVQAVLGLAKYQIHTTMNAR